MLVQRTFRGGLSSAVQDIEFSGLNSEADCRPTSAAAVWTASTEAAPGEAGAADPAARGEHVDDGRELTASVEGAVRRAGAELIRILPSGDGLALALLAASGRISWPEIHAALDGRIRLASRHSVGRRLALGSGRPSAGTSGTGAGPLSGLRAEREIRARYDARCTAIFAAAPVPQGNGPRAHEQLLGTDRLLDVCRIARDDELADLEREGWMPRSAPLAEAFEVISAALEPTGEEQGAMERLEAVGFAGSDGFREIVCRMADEVADGLTARLRC